MQADFNAGGIRLKMLDIITKAYVVLLLGGPQPDYGVWIPMQNMILTWITRLFTLLVIPISLVIGVAYAKKKAFSSRKKWLVISVILAIYLIVLYIVFSIIRLAVPY